MSMLSRWSPNGYYAHHPQFGGEASYEKAVAFLDGEGVLEDWGCGGAWAKRYVKTAEYRGVDGSVGYCDVVADLSEHESQADFILLRHVLEHNWDWEKILTKAVASARKRLCVVIFTPFQAEDDPIDTAILTHNSNGTPDLRFKKSRLLAILGKCREETIESATQYGAETLFYVERLPYGLKETVVESRQHGEIESPARAARQSLESESGGSGDAPEQERAHPVVRSQAPGTPLAKSGGGGGRTIAPTDRDDASAPRKI